MTLAAVCLRPFVARSSIVAVDPRHGRKLRYCGHGLKVLRSPRARRPLTRNRLASLGTFALQQLL